MRESFQMQMSLHCKLGPVQYLEIQFMIDHFRYIKIQRDSEA